MKIYIDSEFCCHAASGDGLREVESSFFDDKCLEFIEGYRYIPEGETWTRGDGATFTGEMVAPIRDYAILSNIQSAVDRVSAELDESYRQGVNSL